MPHTTFAKGPGPDHKTTQPPHLQRLSVDANAIGFGDETNGQWVVASDFAAQNGALADVFLKRFLAQCDF